MATLCRADRRKSTRGLNRSMYLADMGVKPVVTTGPALLGFLILTGALFLCFMTGPEDKYSECMGSPESAEYTRPLLVVGCAGKAYCCCGEMS
jgi:hypothetical protein